MALSFGDVRERNIASYTDWKTATNKNPHQLGELLMGVFG
jgi:hypothetical protein